MYQRDRSIEQTVFDYYKQMRTYGWANQFGGGLSIKYAKTSGTSVYAVPIQIQEGRKFEVQNVVEFKNEQFENDISSGMLHAPFERRLYVNTPRECLAFATLHSNTTNSRAVAQMATTDVIRFSDQSIIERIPDRLDNRNVHLKVIGFDGDIENEIRNLTSTASSLLVRGYGLFVWAESMETGLQQLEAYEDLFELAVKIGHL